MKKKALGLIGIAALAAVGGTFAYFSATETFTNPFNTTNFSTSSTEKFNPSEGGDWKPGKEVDKEVFAKNTGDGLVWVRVKFDEKWERKAIDGKGALSIGWNSKQSVFFPEKADEALSGGTYHQPGSGEDNDAVAGNEDGVAANDIGSVVYKNLLNYTKDAPEGEAEVWYYNKDDGYFYYAKALEKDKETVKLLDSVTLCGNTDMGFFEEIDKWLVVDKGAEAPDYTPGNNLWVNDEPSEEAMKDKDVYHYQAHQLDTERQGYANADYTLNITVEFIQADEEAAQAFPEDSKWNWWPGKDTGDGGQEGGDTPPAENQEPQAP